MNLSTFLNIAASQYHIKKFLYLCNEAYYDLGHIPTVFEQRLYNISIPGNGKIAHWTSVSFKYLPSCHTTYERNQEQIKNIKFSDFKAPFHNTEIAVIKSGHRHLKNVYRKKMYEKIGVAERY